MNLFNNSSVVIVTYNHKDFIESCLNSLKTDEELEIIVVDNNSTDGTPEFIETNFPQVRLVKSQNNNGYGAGINLGMEYATRAYVVILNPDTKVKENAIEKLLKPLKNKDKLITAPKVLNYDGSKINTCGNIPHFTGLAFTRGLGLDPKELNKPGFINGLSGVCFAITRKNYWKLGGFNEYFFLYMEDTEFSWRAKSQGFKIWYVPNSVVFHKYTLEVNPEKIYHLEKGRYLIIREYLNVKDHLILLPSFIMTEILTWGYSTLNGFDGIKFKIRGLRDGFGIDLVKIDSNKKELLKSLDFEIPEDQLTYGSLSKVLKKFANLIYRVNYVIMTLR